MQKIIGLVFTCLLIVGCSKKEIKTPDIVPRPVSLTVGEDVVEWKSGSLSIVAKTEDEKHIASLLQEFFASKNISGSIVEATDDENKIILATVADESLPDEGYNLVINKNGVLLQARTSAGLFYGAQTLMQSISADGKEVPFITITDYPRFSYRGLHLDVGRHMFPPAFIKKYIDLLAKHKFNRFHWHLTEDQGWRIEIKKYPKLQEIAAFRKETVIGKATTKTRSQVKGYDGQRYGGYYTQDEIRDIVKYAAERYVTIIPEIELPGHAMAALAAYPNLGCTSGPYETATTWGVFDDVFCAGKEDAFVFLQDVLDEVITLFPGQYIHIGGDECPKGKWEVCPHCKKRMKTENLKDTHALQSYFIQRIEKYLNSKGKQIIGWDEILEGGLAPNATVMSWRGEEGGIAAAQQDHDVIMTPEKWCYFDYHQDPAKKAEPIPVGSLIDVKRVYTYEPVPSQLTAEQAKHILGVQANVWTEYMKTSDYVEHMVYPRACAMAEVGWSSKESRDYTDFLKRMSSHIKRLDNWNVNYSKLIQAEIDSVNALQK